MNIIRVTILKLRNYINTQRYICLLNCNGSKDINIQFCDKINWTFVKNK